MFLLLCFSWPKFKRENKNFGIDSVKVPKKRTVYSSTTFESIRIKLDFQYFDGTTSDPLKCQSEGDYITWNGETFQCIASDIPNSTKIAAFKGTMTNIGNYLEKLLKVLPSTDPISLESDSIREQSIVQGTNITDTDLYLVFFLRPFSNAVRSSTTVSFKEQTYSRCIQANFYMNQENLPDTVQGEDTSINGDFYRILRNVLNAVALSDSFINKFHPKYDSTVYDSIVCNLTKYGKTFSVLTTPYAHYYAMKNYGNETFYGDDKTCPSGIIIEDSGPSPGDGAESTIYYTDISNSESTQGDYGKFRRVTDVTMAFLLDSGHYEVNWSMGQPLIWGNKDSIDGNYISGWPLSPPETALPDNYFYDPSSTQSNVGYDFNTWGTPTTQVVNCTNPSSLADIHY
ncbi:hypothetical protein TVAG_491780 [Trichomonas vaginalis G3]|uniref:GP63-like n=1 Tax=Trichomonas vaginalis (strain ATCC PRA-98 / G3) TaxID=412133 RepID=A2EAK9_TRIV3|nr:regulation of choline O-acetyltransferase protein [Trichomonas vaginalis G3]EAY10320.1 hypothetical protein TVAG_491780 [Trichomonas vaginalis G3]KAI5491037.1 regulation of choline O-acetyltransferase protein [Trichomonas vaginalis G3]|eukprot:XP_001322543.1 hypothetical protein [Trichomonas vaginalis G3]